MRANARVTRVWAGWLSAAPVVLVVFGSMMVIAPGFARQTFSWMVYGSAVAMDGFGEEAVRYLSLVHAVIGAILIGWGVTLGLLVRAWVARQPVRIPAIIGYSLGAWFLPDTTYSIVAGFWQNALLNLGFLGLFAIPLLALRAVRRAAEEGHGETDLVDR